MFKREGDDIVVEVPITFDEAVLGGKVEVPTITGRVFATVPPGSNTGQTLRLKGRGIKRGGRPAISWSSSASSCPSGSMTISRLREKWRESHRYDPRRKLKEQA